MLKWPLGQFLSVKVMYVVSLDYLCQFNNVYDIQYIYIYYIYTIKYCSILIISLYLLPIRPSNLAIIPGSVPILDSDSPTTVTDTHKSLGCNGIIRDVTSRMMSWWRSRQRITSSTAPTARFVILKLNSLRKLLLDFWTSNLAWDAIHPLIIFMNITWVLVD